MPLRQETTSTAPLGVEVHHTLAGYLVRVSIGWNGFTMPAQRLPELEDALLRARRELEGLRALEER